jgi:hypothetical protein
MKKLKINNYPELKIKGMSKFYLTIYTPDGPDDTECCAIDFSNGNILYASGNFPNFQPDYENFYAYIVEPFGKDLKENEKFTYNQDMFQEENYHENLTDEEIQYIDNNLIENEKYKDVISQAQEIVPDGGYNLMQDLFL